MPRCFTQKLTGKQREDAESMFGLAVKLVMNYAGSDEYRRSRFDDLLSVALYTVCRCVANYKDIGKSLSSYVSACVDREIIKYGKRHLYDGLFAHGGQLIGVVGTCERDTTSAKDHARAILDKMSASDAEVAYMFLGLEMSQREIASRLGVTESAARKRIVKAVEVLRQVSGVSSIQPQRYRKIGRRRSGRAKRPYRKRSDIKSLQSPSN